MTEERRSHANPRFKQQRRTFRELLLCPEEFWLSSMFLSQVSFILRVDAMGCSVVLFLALTACLMLLSVEAPDSVVFQLIHKVRKTDSMTIM